MIYLSLLPAIISGIIGMILDIKYEIEQPALYWTLGVIGGFSSLLIAVLLKG